MEQQAKQILAAAGIDLDALMDRVMGSEALARRLLLRFLEDQNYANLQKALEAGDVQAAIAASHGLKGVCANLSMTGLHRLLARQVELLRAGDLAGAEALMPQIGQEYRQTAAAVEEAFA